MIKNVIFDCSDTLLHLGAKEYLDNLVGDRERAERIHFSFFHTPLWMEYDRGFVTNKEFEDKMLPLLPAEDRAFGKAYLDNWYRQFSVIEGMPALLKELKEKGIKIYLLSDFPHVFETLWEQFDFMHIMDGRMISYEEGLRKSDGGLFERLMEKFDLSPAECAFVDDAVENIAMTNSVGIRGILFTDPKTLKKQLIPLLSE